MAENKKTFGSTEIQKITGFSKSQVIHLTEKGIVIPYKDAGGTGNRRVYSFENLVEFLVCRELQKMKVNNNVTRTVIQLLGEKLPDVTDKTTVNEEGGKVLDMEEIGPAMTFWEKIKADKKQLNNPFLFVLPDALNDGRTSIQFWDFSFFENLVKIHFFPSFIVVDMQKIVDTAMKQL